MRNLSLYRIAAGENPDFRIPYLKHPGTMTGILPVIDMGIGGRDGGQIGAGFVTAPLDCFESACSVYGKRYAV